MSRGRRYRQKPADVSASSFCVTSRDLCLVIAQATRKRTLLCLPFCIVASRLGRDKALHLPPAEGSPHRLHSHRSKQRASYTTPAALTRPYSAPTLHSKFTVAPRDHPRRPRLLSTTPSIDHRTILGPLSCIHVHQFDSTTPAHDMSGFVHSVLHQPPPTSSTASIARGSR